MVGFFDILGTRDAVMSDRFDDVDALEFVNPIGLVARVSPTVRFAVFSDSLIISAELSEIKPLLRAINYMYGNWLSELIYVRGAISYGEIRWVDDTPSDKLFRGLPNLTYGRVYGKGLVAAHELEQKSGPGVVCFLTEQAAELFRREELCSVLENLTPLLCWATQREAIACQGYAKLHLEKAEKDTLSWRHASATKHYWDMVVSQQRFLPDGYSLHEKD
jgi:hypothetical protein